MTETTTHNLIEALKAGGDAAFPMLRKHLDETFKDKSILETKDHAFNPFYFASYGKCTWRKIDGAFQEWTTYWVEEKRRIHEEPFHGCIEVDWEGRKIQIVLTGVQGGHCREERKYLLGDSIDDLRQFFKAVCEFCSELRHEILVFDDGFWTKDDELYDAIKSSTLENLVLEGTLKQDIVDDIERFFNSKETFEKYKIAWKRGLLFLGPPGNGKTHMLKALANHFGVPFLYVRNFVSDHATDHGNISDIFEKARSLAPCFLVFEDLDAHITDKNRSYFLNELDGFYENKGILAIATTNHPDRLDPAIVDRPSRFDRKYHFDLPSVEQRREFLVQWNTRLVDELRVNEAELSSIVEGSEGFSFAYLKELGLSAMTLWIAQDGAKPMRDCLEAQCEWLRDQMGTLYIDHDSTADEATPKQKMWFRMQRMRRERLTE